MTNPDFQPRFILPRLTEALEGTPVVLITGAEACRFPCRADGKFCVCTRLRRPSLRVGSPGFLVLYGQRVAGVEIKAAATVMDSDFRGLRKLKESVGKRFAASVVLYDGETTAPFGDQLFAVPIRSLWEMA